MKFDVALNKVCPSRVSFDLDGEIVRNVVFSGGCNGNLSAISKLIEGMNIEQIEGFFKGNTCGSKDTSCADQLAKILRSKYEELQTSK